MFNAYGLNGVGVWNGCGLGRLNYGLGLEGSIFNRYANILANNTKTIT